jgi:hypothetical protein
MKIGNFSIEKIGVFSRKSVAASQTFEKPQLAAKPPTKQVAEAVERGRTLLIINARTTKLAINQALVTSSREIGLPLWIIYTAKPTLLTEGKSEGEVDYEFAFQLQYGRGLLDSISNQAKSLGIKNIETSFIWANSSAELVKKNKEPWDSIIDLAVN